MKCRICGKQINEYGKFGVVIAGKLHYICVWCYQNVQNSNEILKGESQDVHEFTK
jgi:hypothetical protein